LEKVKEIAQQEEQKERSVIWKYLEKHFPLKSLIGEDAPKASGPSAFNQQRFSSKTKHYVLQVLKISPWLCGLGLALAVLMGFGLSFFEKSLSDTFLFLGTEVSFLALQDLIKNVTVGGLIGYGTNYLAIRMLFRPVNKRPIWGQGLIPAQKDDIIDSLAKGMHEHILSQSLIQQRIQESGLIKRLNDILFEGAEGFMRDEEMREAVKTEIRKFLDKVFDKDKPLNAELGALITERLEAKADKGITKWMLNTYRKVNYEGYETFIKAVVAEIPDGIMAGLDKGEEKIEDAITVIQDQRRASEIYMLRFIMKLLRRIDIRKILANQMKHFDETRLERMIWEATNEQLLYIQYLGTVLGMLGGLIIWNDHTIWVYLILIGILYGLDTLIHRLKKPSGDSVVSK
jgi:uncharacterized membrane protein YheB (UPF0754 family)